MIRRRHAALTAVLTLVLAGGCGETWGGLMYHLNLVPRRKMPAQFELTTGVLLILVDDDMELVTWPPASARLIDEVGKQLQWEEAVGSAIPSSTVASLRHAEAKFDQLPLSELGQQLGADQVLWLQVREFVATTNIESVSRAARLTLRVKVFDPNAERKSELRLWPGSRDGEVLSVEKGAMDVQPLDSDAEVAKMLVDEMVDMVAKLFYKHPIEE